MESGSSLEYFQLGSPTERRWLLPVPRDALVAHHKPPLVRRFREEVPLATGANSHPRDGSGEIGHDFAHVLACQFGHIGTSGQNRQTGNVIFDDPRDSTALS